MDLEIRIVWKIKENFGVDFVFQLTGLGISTIW